MEQKFWQSNQSKILKCLFGDDYSKLIDKSLELQVAKTFKKDMSPTLIKMKIIRSIILDVKSNVTVKHLSYNLSELEMLLTTRLEAIDDYLIADDDVPRCLKLLKFSQLVYIMLFLFFVYFCFHAYYEQRINIKLRFYLFEKND